MTPAELEAVLQAAFRACSAAGYSLSARQKQIVIEVVRQLSDRLDEQTSTLNPLDELDSQQRQALLGFVKAQEREHRLWKATLFDDWLQGRDSGAVQFIRDAYGMEWLARVETHHLVAYEDELDGAFFTLQVGDRLEVSNRLWVWVQNDAPQMQEWLSCTAVGLEEVNDGENSYTNCTVRFDNGAEYEIQGVYQWNRYNWRWAREG
ncbi:MAG: hypothetical protein SWY16_01330 [Cyanobacteriota bacterium]|nr:hypothetical protein [Cyanobacteriota bacterium]